MPRAVAKSSHVGLGLQKQSSSPTAPSSLSCLGFSAETSMGVTYNQPDPNSPSGFTTIDVTANFFLDVQGISACGLTLTLNDDGSVSVVGGQVDPDELVDGERV